MFISNITLVIWKPLCAPSTLPEARGQWLGTRVTARLCMNLLRQVEHIGLNVRADNAPALASYRKLGFERIASYEEFMITWP